MTDIFSLTTSASWRKLNKICCLSSQAQESKWTKTQLHAINFLSIAPYSRENTSTYLEGVASSDTFAACSLSLYRASLLVAYIHIINKDLERAHEECSFAITSLKESLIRLGISTKLKRYDSGERARSFINSLTSQAELQEARTKNMISSHLLFVLGMHRSGTSAVTGMLAQAGFSAPTDLMQGNIANPKGFWESVSTVKLNDDFLEQMESHWSSSLPLPAGWNESIGARAWRTSLISTISQAYEGATLPAIKDPRFCILLKGLEPWLESRLIETSFIMPIRHPLEVSNSLLQAERIDRDKSLRLWIKSILQSEQATRGYRRKFINFDDLLRDPTNALKSCLQLIKSNGDIEISGKVTDGISALGPKELRQASSFIDQNLRRQRVGMAEDHGLRLNKKRSSRIFDLAEAIFHSILANAKDDQSISDELDKLQPSMLHTFT